MRSILQLWNDFHRAGSRAVARMNDSTNQIPANCRERSRISLYFFITYLIISNLAPKRFLSRKWQEGRASSREINSWLSRWLTQIQRKDERMKILRQKSRIGRSRYPQTLSLFARFRAMRSEDASRKKIGWTKRRRVCLTAQRLSKHWRPLPIMAARNRAVQVSLPPPPSPPRAPRSHLYR